MFPLTDTTTIASNIAAEADEDIPTTSSNAALENTVNVNH